MVVGKGLIGKAFSNLTELQDNLVIFASGVSNSNEKSEKEFKREEDLLRRTILENPDKKILYFSTCSILKISPSDSHYIRHKLHMEEIVKTCSSYLILRLPNVVGYGGNPNNLVNYLIDHVCNEKRVEVWKDSYRNIIDMDNVVSIVNRLLEKEISNCTLRIASTRNYSIQKILNYIEEFLGKKAQIVKVSKGMEIQILPSKVVIDTINELKLEMNENYFKNILVKYYKQVPNY